MRTPLSTACGSVDHARGMCQVVSNCNTHASIDLLVIDEILNTGKRSQFNFFIRINIDGVIERLKSFEN